MKKETRDGVFYPTLARHLCSFVFSRINHRRRPFETPVSAGKLRPWHTVYCNRQLTYDLLCRFLFLNLNFSLWRNVFCIYMYIIIFRNWAIYIARQLYCVAVFYLVEIESIKISNPGKRLRWYIWRTECLQIVVESGLHATRLEISLEFLHRCLGCKNGSLSKNFSFRWEQFSRDIKFISWTKRNLTSEKEIKIVFKSVIV